MRKYLLLLFASIVFIPEVMTRTNEIMVWKLFTQIVGVSILCVTFGLLRPFRQGTSKPAGPLGDRGATSILLFAGTLFFWMIPRSVDLTAQSMAYNYLMLFNITISAVFLGMSARFMPFVLKMAIIIYGLSMVLTMGMVYYSSRSLLCAVYTVQMQNEAGRYLLMFFPVLFALFLLFSALNVKKMAAEN